MFEQLEARLLHENLRPLRDASIDRIQVRFIPVVPVPILVM
jgi:hypothetical protein